jgi:hypothetical protein
MEQNNFSKVNREELIKTFSDIDDKINDLHKRSSADFLQLNNYLKDYYKKTNTVSENAFRILETIAGKTDINLIEELEAIYRRLEDSREKIKEDDSVKMQILRDVALKANQLNIALRNIKQDLTSFKFLSTNYNFISNYEESEVKWKKELEQWDNEILSLQSSLASISTQVDRFREQIVYNIDHLELKIEKSLMIFMSLSKETKVNIEIVVQKNQESKLHFPILKERTTDSSKSINNIITHLQYHDIIRQKIEHIQASHYKIINALNESMAQKDAEMARISEDYQKIGDIAGLQAAQLLLVSKEYQNALDIITRNFQGIAEDLSIISNISSDFSYKDNNSEVTLLKQIRNKLDEGIIMLDLNNFRGMNAEYLSSRKKLDTIAETIKKEISEPLRKLDKFEKINGKGEAEERPRVILQVSSLTGDINNKNADICGKINELQKLTEKLSLIDNLEDFGSQLEQDRIKLMVDISRILDTLDKDNEELDNVLMQNRDLNNYILEKIESVINKVDYYEYFEAIVEQVIAQLNSINYRLKPPSSGETKEEKAENLKEIKTSYTMESERIIHDQVVSGEDDQKTPEAERPEDDIEFF